MQWKSSTILALGVGVIAALVAFTLSATSDYRAEAQIKAEREAEAVFAGGCFWCVEADFDKLQGVVATISGYTGGAAENPTYKQVTFGNTGHYEAVKVVYDATQVSYEELVEYFWRHIDPTDDGGQFCDRGESYRPAIFVDGKSQQEIAEASKASLEASGVLDKPLATPILKKTAFWAAEDYHQDYYKKNPVRYHLYRNACGRDATIRDVWKNEANVTN